MNINHQFKPGEKVCCIGDNLHIECTVISDNGSNIAVEDPLTGRIVYIPRNQIDYDKQYYRDKKLENLLK
jgi:hypothetical protein